MQILLQENHVLSVSIFLRLKTYFYLMNLSFLHLTCISFILLLAISCKKKKDTPVSYSVTLTRAVDSLPCSADIEYRFGTRDPSDTHSEKITGDWRLSHTCMLNEKVTLKAVSVSNVKTILVLIEADGSSSNGSCYTQGCTAYTEKSLGNQ